MYCRKHNKTRIFSVAIPMTNKPVSENRGFPQNVRVALIIYFFYNFCVFLVSSVRALPIKVLILCFMLYVYSCAIETNGV